MNAESLTTLIHRRAEKKLRSEIEALLPNPCDVRESVKLSDETMSNLSNLTNSQGECWVPYLILATIEALYAVRVDAERSAAVREFLAKVEKTAEDLNEIMEGME